MTIASKVSLLSLAIGMMMTAAPSQAQDSQVPGPDSDPFIWLEEARSDKALHWVRAENARTEAELTSDPRFETLKAEALAILDSDDRIPYVSFGPDGMMYNFWQDKENPKGILRRTSLASYRSDNPAWETVLDVDALAAAEGREWVYGGSTCYKDTPLCMVALSDGGKDANVLREFNRKTGQFVENGFVLAESQGGVSWIDENTLMVSRDFGEGTLTESQYPFVTKIWTRGSDLADAQEFYRGAPNDVSAGAYPLRDNKDEIQAMVAYRGLSFHERQYALRKDDAWVTLDMPKKAGLFGIIDGQILFSTDEDWTVGEQTFPADALVAADLEAWKADPNGVAKTLVWAPGDRQTKQGAAITSESLYVGLLDNVRGKALKFDFVDGAWVSSAVDVPRNATVSIGASDDKSDTLMFNVTDFLSPSRLYLYDGQTAQLEQIKSAPSYFDAAGMSVEQLEATSADGTRIPYFLVKPKGMKMDGSTPVLLSGYGGFQVPRLPSYLGTTGKLWLARGGAYVLANLRGGGEFGPMWHQTAIRENKQRTWDDFIAVAQDLVDRNITSPAHLGIQGGSQGGLLVGTAFTQRPDLFDAAIVQIPLFDMLRYHEIGRGASWIGEYGDPRIPEQRAWIEPYSPYQKLDEDKDFPKPFFITSTADDRTHPAHGRKAAAKMAANGDDYLYYEDMVGGHSGGVDNEQRAKLLALQNVYLMKQLMD